VEMILKGALAGFRVVEVPVSYYPRIGKSKISGTLKGTVGAAWFILSLIVRYYFRHRRGPIAVVAIKEHNHVRGICHGQTREARSPLAAAAVLKDAGFHSCGDLGRPVIRVAVDNDDLRREIGREICQNALNRLRFIMGRDDDG